MPRSRASVRAGASLALARSPTLPRLTPPVRSQTTRPLLRRARPSPRSSCRMPSRPSRRSSSRTTCRWVRDSPLPATLSTLPLTLPSPTRSLRIRQEVPRLHGREPLGEGHPRTLAFQSCASKAPSDGFSLPFSGGFAAPLRARLGRPPDRLGHVSLDFFLPPSRRPFLTLLPSSAARRMPTVSRWERLR